MSEANRWLPGRYCRHIGRDPVQHWQWISDSDETVRFLYGFFGWRCDIRRGKNGRYCPGIGYKSSLESFWKWWHLVLKQEAVSGLGKDTIVKVQDVSNQSPFGSGQGTAADYL
jgi:hypothetical protein